MKFLNNCIDYITHFWHNEFIDFGNLLMYKEIGITGIETRRPRHSIIQDI